MFNKGDKVCIKSQYKQTVFDEYILYSYGPYGNGSPLSITILDGVFTVIEAGTVINRSFNIKINKDGFDLYVKEFEIELVVNNLNDSSVLTTNCYHQWKKYQGLSESFEYCDRCGVKK